MFFLFALESLENDQKINIKNPDILELCNLVPNEVLNLGTCKGYDVDEGIMTDMDVFNQWLQCYNQDGMYVLIWQICLGLL